MKYCIIFFLCFAQIGFAQNFKNAPKFVGKWKSVVAHVPDAPYMYLSKASKDAKYNVFDFTATGKIKYESKISGNCHVGAMEVRDGMWKLEDENTLVLDVRGLKIADYWFWYRIRYKIVHITDQEIKLQFVKIIRNRKISPSKFEWEDLIGY